MLLINPDSRIYRQIPNVSLAYAAAQLQAPVVDLNTAPDDPDRFLQAQHEAVFLSVRSNTERAARQLRDRYLERYPSARVSTIRNCVDVLCCYPFKEWPEGLSIQPTFGDELPFPAYERFDSFPVYRKNWQTGTWPYFVMTSLGCPFACTYCASRKRPYRVRSADHCLEELSEAKARWGIRRFAVLDDCFNVSKKRVLAFCERVRTLDLPWVCANGLRCDRFDEEMAKALKQANCEQVGFGVESIDDAVLQRIQKGETAEQIEQAITIARKYFPGKVGCFFIIGLPGSTYESDLAGVRWAIRQTVAANFSFFVDHDNSDGEEVFYGEAARPMSDSYDRRLQQKIYDYTNYMHGYKSNRFRKLRHVWNTLKLILLCDPRRLPIHVLRYARIFFHN